MLNTEILDRIRRADMVNLGSGPSAYAFDYESAGVNGVNLAMTPSAFALESAFLNEYRDVFSEAGKKAGGCAVILAVCPFSFGENRSNGNPGRYARYYNVLSKVSVDALPAPLPHWDPAVSDSVSPDAPLFPYEAGVHPDEIPSPAVMEERVESMCRCWKQEFSLVDFLDAGQAERHKAAFRREREELEKLISLCRALGLRPYLLLPPLHPLLRARISDAFFGAFVREQVKGLSAPLLDYTDSPLITGEMFFGPVFLNRGGAAFFTKTIYDAVKQDGNSEKK